MAGPETIETGYAPIKAWVAGVPVHVAVMPDVHLGKCATVGSVIATRAAIVPAAVGVDIGCGMMAVRTTLTASSLPDSLARLRLGIEGAVPHGGVGLKGGWKEGVPNTVARRFAESGLSDGLKALEEKHKLLMLLDRVQRARELQIFIGTESEFSAAGEVSVPPVDQPFRR